MRSGDPKNVEAQASRRYWNSLFASDFRRDFRLSGINAALNYGYAVLTASLARSIVGTGLLVSIGVHCHNRSNPLCLAPDLIEPFRPIVDWRVRSALIPETKGFSLDDRKSKSLLLSLMYETIFIAERREPLLIAVQSAAASLYVAFLSGPSELALPTGVPISTEPVQRLSD